MNPMLILAALALAMVGSAVSPAALAAERPVSGQHVAGLESVDQVVLELMDQIGCQATTVALSRHGKLVYSRGFGGMDATRPTSVPPDALMRIASVTKPITAAAVKIAIRDQLLSAETKAFELLAIKPPGGTIADPRIRDITIGQLLEHRGGWDREATFDPMFRASQIARELKLSRPVTPENVIESMLLRPLQFTPGERVAYSNFGYCVLGRVLETVMNKPYADCIRQAVCDPLQIRDIRLGAQAAKDRDPREVGYPVADDAFPFDVMDAHGGLIASAPALCQFLEAYWITGEPRRSPQRADWTFFGSLPGTTAMVRQRADGWNLAVLMNGRREPGWKDDNEALKKRLDAAIDRIPHAD